MSSKLIISELKAHKDRSDAIGNELEKHLAEVVAGAKVNFGLIQLANAISKNAMVAKGLVDSSLDVNLHRPELARIVDAGKPRRMTASDREWKAAAAKPALALRPSRKRAKKPREHRQNRPSESPPKTSESP